MAKNIFRHLNTFVKYKTQYLYLCKTKLKSLSKWKPGILGFPENFISLG